mgnify:CR=1 FL=1
MFLIREGSHNLMLLIVQEISRKKNLTIPGVGKHIIIDNFQICLRLWAPTQLRMDMVGLKSFFFLLRSNIPDEGYQNYTRWNLCRVYLARKKSYISERLFGSFSLHFLSESRLNQRTPYCQWQTKLSPTPVPYPWWGGVISETRMTILKKKTKQNCRSCQIDFEEFI